MPMSGQTAELHLLRYLPGESAVHRLWAGTKLLSLTALVVAVTLKPTWQGEAILLTVLALAIVATRIPLGAFPRLPRWFWLGLGIWGAVSLAGGGAPHVHLAGVTLG